MLCEVLEACAELYESCCKGAEVITICWSFMQRFKNSKEL